MNSIFGNAVQSIQIGIEDYQSNDSRRTISAVRNFYAGVLLLAKYVLVKRFPLSSQEEILSAKYRPVPDGKGGVTIKPYKEQTIDFNTLADRFKDFGLSINRDQLTDLNRIRNDIEHKFTTQNKDSVREAIAKAFPVVSQLFNQLGENPAKILEETWNTMLEVKNLYESELLSCQESFNLIDWNSGLLKSLKRFCPSCGSELIAQKHPENTDFQCADSDCRVCGAEISPEDLFGHSIEKRYEGAILSAMMDGDSSPLNICPECGVNAYVTDEDYTGCLWCGETLQHCSVCEADLTPNNVSWDNNNLCSYCAHKLFKDD